MPHQRSETPHVTQSEPVM